jgi:toxin ParE1/3/4
MEKRDVRILPSAAADLTGLYDYIANEAGTGAAAGYIQRIEAACRSLETVPHRGTARDDIRPGLRTMGFERRATIVFHVGADEVTIVRVFCGGRDYERLLGRSRDAGPPEPGSDAGA